MPVVNFSHFFKQSKAFFIGVTDYSSPAISNLYTPANDVSQLSQVLKNLHGFEVEPVSGKKLYANPLINPDAKDVFDFLEHIPTSKEDRLILYFACHGIAIDSEGSPEGYLLMADAVPGQWDSFVRMSDIMSQLNKLNCKHLLLILDCCYAGAFRWASAMRSPGEDVPRTIYFERFQQYAGNKAWQILTSSAHDQKAIDTLALKLGQREAEQSLSPFAQVLIRALETGNADLSYGSIPSDGIITATELGYYLKEEIFRQLHDQGIQGDKQQLPMLFPLIDANREQFGKGEFVFLNLALSADRQHIGMVHRTDKNPYRGLDAYQVEDNLIFYGRQRVMKGWYDGRSRQPGLIEVATQYKLIILTGPSGIGKSSLAKAGLLSYYKGKRRLEQIRPGKTPVHSHEQLFMELSQAEGAILLVDQYEELITTTIDNEERIKFEQALLELMERHLVIITIRSDFEGLFKTSPVFQAHHAIYRFVVPPFLRAEIEEIVVQPAAQENLEFRPEINNETERGIFIDRIVNDAYQNPASLPLLSLALSELYEKGKGTNNLLETEYEKFGGITGILEVKITEAYEQFGLHQQAQFRNLIFRMITIDSGRILKRRVYTSPAALNMSAEAPAGLFDELLFREDADTREIKEIAGKLVKERLLSPGKEDSGLCFVEPSHDALLKWSRLLLWLKEQSSVPGFTVQEQVQLQKTLSDTVKSYQEADSKEQLAMVKSWTKHPRLHQLEKELAPILNKAEAEFINRVSRHNKRQSRIRNAFLLAVGSVILLLGIFGWVQANRIANVLTRNKAMLLASESEQYGATEHLAMLRQAYRVFKDSSIESKLYKLLNTYDYTHPFAIDYFEAGKPVNKLFYSEQTNALVITTEDSVYLRDVAGRKNKDPGNEADSLFSITATGEGIVVRNLSNHQAITLKEKDLAGYYLDLGKGGIYLLVADSLAYYNIHLDYKLNYVSRKKVLESEWHNPVKYYAGRGYYIIDLLEESMLFTPEGECIDRRGDGIKIIGLHWIHDKITEVLHQAEPAGICLAAPGRVKGLHWFPVDYEYDRYTSPDSYRIKDSLFLLVINRAPSGGPGGQSTRLFLHDFKTGKGKSLVYTPNVLPAFSLSADRRMALAGGEDSLYVMDLVHGTTRTLYHKDILAAKFEGSANYFYTVCKASIGYTTTVFDSTLSVIHQSDFSEKPDLICITPLNDRIAISYGPKVLSWKLSPWFNAKPWGDELNNINKKYLKIRDMVVNNSGSWMMIDASILSGQWLPPVYYLGNRLWQKAEDKDWEQLSRLLPISGKDTVIEIKRHYFTGTIQDISYVDLLTSVSYPVQQDSTRQLIINMLTGNRLSLKVKHGIVFQENNTELIPVDSFEHMLLNWEGRYFMDQYALVKENNTPDGARMIYEAGKIPRKSYDWALPAFPWTNGEDTYSLVGFVYGNTAVSREFQTRLKALTGYDVKTIDSLVDQEVDTCKLMVSDQGILLLNRGNLYHYDVSTGFIPEGPGNILGAALYDNAYRILMVNNDGIVYLKKTRKYLDWFLRAGYTIPLKISGEAAD